MFSVVIELIAIDYKKDELGQEIEVPSNGRKVFANKKSVSQSEFFNAGLNGFKPQFLFEIHSSEYKNEPQLKFNNVTYSIYRTYEKAEFTELYCEIKVGV